MKFIAMPASEKNPTVLSLRNANNGTVELWAYTAALDDGYRIGIFKDGMFIADSMSKHAISLLNLVLTDGGHIVTKLR